MPTPRPAMILPSIIMPIFSANVWSAPPTKNMHDPYRIVFRRPIMSPIRPTIRDEIKAPTSRMATIVPICALEGWPKYSTK